MNIILFGATGLVGNEVRKFLHSHHSHHKIGLVVRKKLKDINPGEVEILSDLTSHEDLKNRLMDLRPEVAFCCLGTTMKKAGSKHAFYHVDHELILNCAKAAYLAGAKSFGVISSSGADARSDFYYLKVKGETEKDLMGLGFAQLVILRPGLLLGKRSESRTLEKLFISLAPFYSKLMKGPLRKFRPIEASSVASCLVRLTTSKGKKVQILESHNII